MPIAFRGSSAIRTMPERARSCSLRPKTN